MSKPIDIPCSKEDGQPFVAEIFVEGGTDPIFSEKFSNRAEALCEASFYARQYIPPNTDYRICTQPARQTRKSMKTRQREAFLKRIQIIREETAVTKSNLGVL